MAELRFYYDYIDPASFLMERRIREAALVTEHRLTLVPWELRTPADPLLDPEDPAWLDWWARFGAEAAADGHDLVRPTRVPRTRKAHELLLHAAERGDAARIHQRLYAAALVEKVDIGRIDVLVEIAVSEGFDRTECKAVLDVDRHSEEVDRLRAEAMEAGIQGVPTLVFGTDRLEGVHPADAIREFVSGI